MSDDARIARSFTDHVQRAWTSDHLGSRGTRVLVAVSGGADSMALLDVLTELRPRLDIQLVVAHLNHGLRGDASDADEAFVREQAEARALPVFAERVDVAALAHDAGASVETTARQARAGVLTRAATEAGAGRIALGHHRDDVAETVLMRLLRGAGSRGLAAMAPLRDGLWIRPLLARSRDEVRAYLDSRQVPHVEDESNTSRAHLRNRVRHDLLPLLARDYNPRAHRALAATSTVLRDEDALLDDMATQALRRATGPNGAHAGDISALPVAIARRVIRRWMEATIVPRPLTFEETERVRAFLAHDAVGPLWLTRRAVLDRQGEHVRVSEAPDAADQDDPAVEVPVPTPGRAEMPTTGMSVRTKFHGRRGFARGPLPTDRAAYDADALPGDLTLRRWRPGDRFQPFGMSGSKTVADYLSDARVPPHTRAAVTVLCSGPEIIWVVGMRADGRYAVTGGTQRILLVDAEDAQA
ncbi:tRNA lysidine(34) synthetase TilS [Candidatus Poribacteria bacterium]|nr:tRNA lysidine(34) synthetase TilS [Candidatus Poribacteria bacterium]MBT5536798.1 tRNA lysidine(34) synthetase TilS [Candidatus Poribacteria bacterium]MBT7098316.1 tRNA lysidine(34) synthetase TilS [Candidatus Poribacteria bacterium]MBT7804114.1 tRNA lysidine(34) synthetase TilS [Candidatus Poribacteria bacterium]